MIIKEQSILFEKAISVSKNPKYKNLLNLLSRSIFKRQSVFWIGTTITIFANDMKTAQNQSVQWKSNKMNVVPYNKILFLYKFE